MIEAFFSSQPQGGIEILQRGAQGYIISYLLRLKHTYIHIQCIRRMYVYWGCTNTSSKDFLTRSKSLHKKSQAKVNPFWIYFLCDNILSSTKGDKWII